MRDLNKYKGIIPAFYACYDENGEISPERVRELTEFHIKKITIHNKQAVFIRIKLLMTSLLPLLQQLQNSRAKSFLFYRQNKNSLFSSYRQNKNTPN